MIVASPVPFYAYIDSLLLCARHTTENPHSFSDIESRPWLNIILMDYYRQHILAFPSLREIQTADEAASFPRCSQLFSNPTSGIPVQIAVGWQQGCTGAQPQPESPQDGIGHSPASCSFHPCREGRSHWLDPMWSDQSMPTFLLQGYVELFVKIIKQDAIFFSFNDPIILCVGWSCND